MLIAEQTKTIDACRFCFMCRHVCTLGVVSGKESDTPRGKGLILFKILKGHAQYTPDLVETVYRCCLCGLCEAWCQASCTPPAAILAARADIVALGQEPAAVRQIKENLLQTGNPFGLPAAERFRSIQAPQGRTPAEVLYYVGCDTAYLQPQIANAFAKLLEAAGVKFTLLAGEHSTGKPLYALGYRDEARAMAQRLAEQIRATGCRTLVTTCPSALDAFKTDYPALGADLGGIEVLHAAQYLDRLVQQKRLTPKKPVATQASVLDGTYLGRTHKLFEEPRRVLQQVPQLGLREMVWTRQFAYAAGEPAGLLRLLHPELSRQLAARVLGEAVQSGVQTLVTTCPVTRTTLAGVEPQGPKVQDLVELLAESVG